MLSTLCSDPLCPVAVMHPVMRSAILLCNLLQTPFFSGQSEATIYRFLLPIGQEKKGNAVAVHLVMRDAMLSHLQPAQRIHCASVHLGA